MNYSIKMSPELKVGDKFILGTESFIVVSDYGQCIGAGHFDFGEYGVIDVVNLSKVPGTNKKSVNIWLYKNLPVILITE